MPNGAEYQKKGTDLFMRRDYEGAAEQFEQAKAAFDSEEKPDMGMEMLVNLALIDHRLGNFDAAVEKMSQARQFFDEHKDAVRSAMVIGNLGGLYLQEGNLEQAFTLLREAADTFKEAGEEDKYGETLFELARMQAKAGKWMEAIASYEVALDLVKQPTLRQKMLKQAIKLRNRAFGGGALKAIEADKDEKKPEATEEK